MNFGLYVCDRVFWANRVVFCTRLFILRGVQSCHGTGYTFFAQMFLI